MDRTTFPYREVQRGDTNALQAWVARGGQIDAPLLDAIAETWTPLMFACAEGDASVARAIVKYGGARAFARVSTKVLASPAPLHIAARFGHTAVATVLVELGADVGAADNIGMSSLHYAAAHGHLRVIQVLLDAGANASVKAPGGATALDMAEMEGFEDVAAALRRRTLGGEAGAVKRNALSSWLAALGCDEFTARFLTAGYDDLAFLATQGGLTDADLDCIGVPREKLGLRKKLQVMHGVEEFISTADGVGGGPGNSSGRTEEASITSSEGRVSGSDDDDSSSDNTDRNEMESSRESASDSSGAES